LPTDLRCAMEKQVSRVRLTAGKVESFACPADKSQVFLWDTDTPSLAVRVTPTGRKTYVFESRLNGSTIRTTIGSVKDWPLDAPERDKDAMSARREASRLATMVDIGIDPRMVERDRQTAAVERKDAAAAKLKADKVIATPASEVWSIYIAARRPHWGDRHYQDHIDLSSAGGVPRKRGAGDTIAGPLHELLKLSLRDMTPAQVQAWAAREAKTRPTQARLAWRLLRAFLSWCNEEPEYAPVLAGVNAAKNKKARDSLGKPQVKQDALLKEQLPAWFSAIQKLPNPVTAAYLQTLLLTGARPGEVMDIKWNDINLQWRGLTIRDKVEGTRVIPLTPYVSNLLTALPRRNAWVFSSARTGTHIKEPHQPHAIACKVAGIDDLTHHGLRRSFKSLTEWLEIPAGVVAQLMGHKPSATAEKHYTVRPLDLLRVHHERIESWILEQAGIKFDAKAAPGKLVAVT
jgi:integrase